MEAIPLAVVAPAAVHHLRPRFMVSIDGQLFSRIDSSSASGLLSSSLRELAEDTKQSTKLARGGDCKPCLLTIVSPDRNSSIAHWDIGRETIVNTFSGFRLPISWDFSETGR